MPNPAFLPTATWPLLHARAQLLRKVREFFHELGFLEVETPLLSADVVIDRHLDPLEVMLYENPQQPTLGQTYYLQTSPEFAMKRLLAGGAEAIYQVTHAFRAGERGKQHNPEFTIVEWYRAGDNMQAGMQLLSDLAEMLFARGPAARVSYRQAFERQIGIDPLKAEATVLASIALEKRLSVPDSFSHDDRDAYLELLLNELIQPQLGRQQPTIMFDYPASQSALARVRDDDPPVAERFELFVDGVELANGYHELLEASQLEQRNQQNNRARVADGKQPLPEASHLLQAMRHGLPACSGTALGFDRAVMVALGAGSIDEVMPFPIERA